MASKAIKGITVEIGGNTVGLQKALNESEKQSKLLSAELRQVNNALKFDPTNTTLLAQKQQILSEQVKNTSDKLQQLKSAQSQVEEKYKSGEIGADAYRAFQREIISTENRLQGLQSEQRKTMQATDQTAESTEGLTEEENELSAQTEKAGTAFDKLKAVAAEAGKAMAVIAEGVGAAALDVSKALVTVYAEMGKLAVKGMQAATNVGKSFESSMSQIAATMGKTTDEISDLTEKAKEMGATTQFSATEAAQGLNILAMSGLDTEEQIAGIEKVLNLAAAGGLSLESAASYTTGTVKGFGDTMENAQYYTDLMAKGATLANTNVNDLGAALSKTAANANSYGQTADGVTLSLLRLAEQNVTGEEAATQLNRAMADLYTPTDNAKQALDELGIAAYDSQGNTRDFNTVVDELNAKLSTMTDEQANAYKNTIFTTNGLNAFNKMTASSTEKVTQFKEELASASEGEGSAAQQAATMIDNLEGDITIMQSAAEGLGITFYETFNKDLRENVQFATESLGQLTDAFKNGGIEEAANVAGGILADIANKAAEYAPIIINTASTLIDSVANTLAENAPSLAQSAKSIILSLANGFLNNSKAILDAIIEIADGIIGELPSIIAILISRAGMLFTSILDFFQNGVGLIVDNVPDIIESIMEAINEELPAIALSLSEAILATAEALLGILPEILPTIITMVTSLIELLLPELINTVIALAQSIAEHLPEILTAIVTALPALIDGILTAVLGQIPVLLQGVFTIVNALIGALPDIIVMIVQTIPQIITSIINAVTTNLPLIIQAGITLFTSLIGALPDIIVMIVQTIPQIITSIINAVTTNLPLIIQAGITLFTSLIGALPDIIKALVAALPQIITSLVTAIVQSIPQLIDGAIQLVLGIVQAIPEIILALIEALPTIIESVITGLIEALPQLIEGGVQLVIGLVKAIPQIIVGLIKAIPDIVTSLVTAFGDCLGMFIDMGGQLISGLWNGISNAADWLWEKISGFFGGIVDGIKDFFGIHSPSTLFRDQIGENLALGIGEGFSDTMTDVTKDMQNALPTSFDVDPAINLSSGDSRMQVLPQTASGIDVVKTDMGTVNFTLNIENFNNADNSSLTNLSDTITYTLYNLIYRQKAVTA